MVRRLHEVRSLSQLLPSGAEGGKEFARIVDLLLFFRADKHHRVVNTFSDRAGDYLGLDSFHEHPIRKDKTTGYQYKFFPSPLSDAHRAAIRESLLAAKNNQKELRLTRWVLVTPDDLTESSQRKGGGDVTWFTELRAELQVGFEIEHWGHRKLQALFLDAPRLSLFYYPELVPDGAQKRKAIAEIRKTYDKTLADTYSRIEFVGLSVYKPEATRGVPMADIYIPVSAVPQNGAEVAARVNPLRFLASGARSVVLGDPGSGKSTLVKFLALVGKSSALQRRYKAPPTDRLPIVVVLRKYADALKRNRDLPLLTFIAKSVQADFSLRDADEDFFESFLDAGKAILLFDGMDELPGAGFKELVRDRIRGFANSYPANTIIVTSRIVGYSAAFGFSPEEFQHFQLAPLLLDEMDKFVEDWYRIRVVSDADRRANVDDLKRIFRNPDQQAIRMLAENPLLLTIVTLVHRIDAVLPDQRVVLYQKCTETLLNTWHTWKFREVEDIGRRSRVERVNRRRIEVLAYHMHVSAGDTRTGARAVLTEQAVLDVLADHILAHENVSDRDEARDLAAEFAGFVKQRAGLLVEVGDGQFSFVHLTFQEYLTATYLLVDVEVGGVTKLWEQLEPRTRDPRWHEVLRLLIASLKSDQSQELIVRQMLSVQQATPEGNAASLMAGLLIDRIPSAESESARISAALLRGTCQTKDANEIARLFRLATTVATRYPQSFDQGFDAVWGAPPLGTLLPLGLMGIACEVSDERLPVLATPENWPLKGFEGEVVALLLGGKSSTSLSADMQRALGVFRTFRDHQITSNPSSNSAAVLLSGVLSALPSEYRAADHLHSVLVALCGGTGPFQDFMANCLALAGLDPDSAETRSPLAVRQARAFATYFSARGKRGPRGDSRLLALHAGIRDELMDARRTGVKNKSRVEMGASQDLDRLARDRTMQVPPLSRGAGKVNSHPAVHLIADVFGLKPKTLWEKALTAKLLPKLWQDRNVYKQSQLDEITTAVTGGLSDRVAIRAASFLFHDLWLYANGGYESSSASPLRAIAEACAASDDPMIRTALLIREMAFTGERSSGALRDSWLAASSKYPEICSGANRVLPRSARVKSI